MRVEIKDFYQHKSHHLMGSDDDVRSQILTLYPFLLTQYGPHCDVGILLDALNQSQFARASIDFSKSERGVDGQGLHVVRYEPDTPHGQMHTVDEQIEALRAAAAFLAGRPCSDQEMRQALLQSDSDPVKAVLLAHGLKEEQLPELEAVASAAEGFQKSEDEPVKFKEVSPATESAKPFADAVRKASEAGDIKHIYLGKGKHNKGMLLAQADDRSYILKPGSGKQNPIVGENESGSTQSQREAAFYSLGAAWGLGKYLPECHLLLVDGMEYACMIMLPMIYKNFNDLKKKDPNLPKRLLHLYNDGTLHKWGALDYVGGNPDRHSGNIMASGDQIRLIDEGSTFAGSKFDPAKDGMSFVPYYLRPGVKDFQKLSVDEKLRVMPRLNHQNEREFKQWLLGLIPSTITQCLIQYGIESAPAISRLRRLQEACGYQSADLAILSAWVVY